MTDLCAVRRLKSALVRCRVLVLCTGVSDSLCARVNVCESGVRVGRWSPGAGPLAWYTYL